MIFYGLIKPSLIGRFMVLGSPYYPRNWVLHWCSGIEYLSCPVSFLKGNLLMNCSRVTWWQPFHVRHLLRWHSRLTCTDLSKNLKRIASCQSRRKKYDKRICVYLVATYTHIHIGVFRWTYMKLDHHRHVSTHCNWCIQCTCRSERSRVKQITEKSTYHWQMDWSLQGKKNQQSSAHRSSYFWNSVTDLFQTDAGNGPLWINRDSNSNVMWNWRNPHFDQPLTNHVQLELFPWKVKESGTTAPLISTNITALICDVAPNFWILPKKTALRNGVGPTQTLVSSSVYVSS